ncbi:MAG TPA: hypothetical protein VJC00_02280 [Candidatus Nanoarchaeia archaeon]|nr:hypothetical protein [Candidatus Nanoarchaeia archaeon]
MGEKQKLYGKSFSYEGIFVFKHMFYEMDSWLREHWYDKFEKWNEQQVKPDGTKQVAFEFVPWKKFTDYFKGTIKIEVMCTNLRDVEVEYDGQKIKAQQGKVDVKLTGYLIVDYAWFYGSRWTTPMLYFLRDLFDKFVNIRYTRKYRRVIVDNVDEISAVMQSYLNTQQYKLMRRSEHKHLGYVK